MTVRYLSVAEAELEEAIDFYEAQEAGLGLRFYDEVISAVSRIRHYPQAWPSLTSLTKRCRTKVFPYGIIYQIRDNEILIVAVAHLHRNPNYWRDRL